MPELLRPWQQDKVYVLSSDDDTQVAESTTAAVMARFILPCAAKIIEIQYHFVNVSGVADLDVTVATTSILSANVDLGEGTFTGVLTPEDPETIYPALTVVDVVQTTGSGDTIDDRVVNLLFVPI